MFKLKKRVHFIPSFNSSVSFSTERTAPYGMHRNVRAGRSTESGAVPIKKQRVLLKNKNLQGSKKLRKIKRGKNRDTVNKFCCSLLISKSSFPSRISFMRIAESSSWIDNENCLQSSTSQNGKCCLSQLKTAYKI